MRAGAGLFFLGVIMLGVSGFAAAVEPSVDELVTARQWFESTLGGAQTVWLPDPGLEVAMNHDRVQKNARFGKPLHVGKETFTRGLFCHAPSVIVVHLPGPGRTFHAVAGIDVNEHTSGGQGSCVFAVRVNDQDRFRSVLLRGTEPGVPVGVNLDGAREFVLAIDDGGDGISCDQADWADARVTLEDGSEIWLADLPLAGGPVCLGGGTPPYSFTYDGQPSNTLLSGWDTVRESTVLDENRTRHSITHTDPNSGLEVQCVAVQYHDFPTVEWTLYFRNAGTSDTPIIEGIQALDIAMIRGDLGEFVLHHARGSDCKADDYGPLETKLEAGGTLHLAPSGGRGSNKVWPYFGIESTHNDGLLVAVGWPGQWAADFARDAGNTLRITAGQGQTRFILHPGEEVRSPLIAIQFRDGDRYRAQNLWRRWMTAHSMPKPGGALPRPQLLGCSSRAYEEMIKADTAAQKMFIDRYLEEKIGIDYWWMDAGWYVQENGWPHVGTWEVDTKRFPGGLRPICDYAHERGVKIVVWFEPERVAPGTWLTENHPEWILGGANGGLLNLGNPEAWDWLVNHIDSLLTEQGIDLYRQDFNMDPLDLWRANDAEDRQGITENRHVTGYLAYWDELLRRHPGLLIDSCASGGRRNDLETMRRAVPLWRSDYAFEPIGHQCMTYGISLWLPFHGTGTVACVNAPYYGGGLTPVEPYAFWSNAAPSLNCGFDMRVREIDYAALRRLTGQWRQVSEFYYGDFYPLTKYSLEPDAWMAWQFHDPARRSGIVQAFRRAESVYTQARLPLRGLEPELSYEVMDLEAGTSAVGSGRELVEQGLEITFSARPEAKVYLYKAAS